MAANVDAQINGLISRIDEALTVNKDKAIQAIKTMKTTQPGAFNTFLLRSIEQNRCNLLNEMLKNTDFDVNHEFPTDFGTITLLFKAIINTSIECVRILIENGADINKPITMIVGSSYPIEVATRNSTIEIAHLLIDNNANITYTAAINCIDRPELFPILLQRNPQHIIQLRNEKNETLLHYYKLINLTIAQQILDAGYDITAIDEKGRTALHVCKTLPILQLFVQRGFNLEARDINGCTPILYLSINHRPEENIQFLIQAGADVTVQDNEGKDLLMYAVLHMQTHIFAYLVDHDININKIYTLDGQHTILDIVNEMLEHEEELEEHDITIFTQMRTQLLERGAVSVQNTHVNAPPLNENTYRQLPYLHVGKNNTNTISMNTFENDNIVGILPTYKSNNVARRHKMYKKNHAFKMYNKNTRRLTNTGKHILKTRKSPLTRENIQPENIKLYRTRVGNANALNYGPIKFPQKEINALNYGPIGSANIEFESTGGARKSRKQLRKKTNKRR